jgi:hypothetical protein
LEWHVVKAVRVVHRQEHTPVAGDVLDPLQDDVGAARKTIVQSHNVGDQDVRERLFVEFDTSQAL